MTDKSLFYVRRFVFFVICDSQFDISSFVFKKHVSDLVNCVLYAVGLLFESIDFHNNYHGTILKEKK